MRGLELPEWGSYENLLLLEWFERERSEKAAALWAVSEAIVISQMDASIGWADKMVYIRRSVERYHNTLWQTKYSPQNIINKMRRRHSELKGDIDRIDALKELG